MKKKICVIANPFSGTTNKENLAAILDKKLDHSKYDLTLKYTEYAGHGKVIAFQACMDHDIIVAVGGDGTVNEVASGIIGQNKTLGILPAGSGNGFAMHLGLGRDTTKAIDVLNVGYEKLVDTCLVNDKFFINVSGIGFDARVAFLTKLNKKRGFMHYFKTTLSEAKHFKPLELTIALDDEKIQGKFAVAVIANASMYGYNFTIAPTAALDDGLFDIMLIKESPVYKYALTSYRFLNKTLHKSPLVICKRSRKISVILENEDYYHVDGEGFEAKKSLSYEIVPKNLKVICNAKSLT